MLPFCVIGVIFFPLRCHSKGSFYTDDTSDPFRINFLVNQSFTTCGYAEGTIYNKVYDWQCGYTAILKNTKHTAFLNDMLAAAFTPQEKMTPQKSQVKKWQGPKWEEEELLWSWGN